MFTLHSLGNFIVVGVMLFACTDAISVFVAGVSLAAAGPMCKWGRRGPAGAHSSVVPAIVVVVLVVVAANIAFEALAKVVALAGATCACGSREYAVILSDGIII